MSGVLPFARVQVDAAVGIDVLTRSSGSLTQWHRDDVDRLLVALSGCKDRRLATEVLLATTALACFLGLSGRWTGSRADILWVIDQLQAALHLGVDPAAHG